MLQVASQRYNVSPVVNTCLATFSTHVHCISACMRGASRTVITIPAWSVRRRRARALCGKKYALEISESCSQWNEPSSRLFENFIKVL